MKVDRDKFEKVIKTLLNTKPLPREKVKASMKRKLGKIIGEPTSQT